LSLLSLQRQAYLSASDRTVGTRINLTWEWLQLKFPQPKKKNFYYKRLSFVNNKNSLLTRFFILIVTVLMTALPTMQASAALVKCRTDPIFELSNGVKVTVTLDINTDASNVKNLDYVLHVPAGVTLTKITFIGGFDSIETYKIIQDSPANTYITDTLVTTSAGVVPVKAKTDVVAKNSTGSFLFTNTDVKDSGNHIIVKVVVKLK
jgi:hypothetical protein